jgi:CRP-like cAMP-binding protein
MMCGVAPIERERCVASSSPTGGARRAAMKIDRAIAAPQNQLLQCLPSADFELIAPHLTETLLHQNEILVEPGACFEYVYFPHTAVISYLAVMQDGQTVETATVGRAGVIGGVAGLGPWRAFARVVVQVPGTAARIRCSRFRAAIRHSDCLTTVIMRCAQSIVLQIQQTAACNALHPVEQRLCRWLLLTQDYAGTNVIPLTQDHLAQMLGVRRTSVTAAVSKLQTVGLIRCRQRGRIQIADRKALERATCECYEVIRSRHDWLVA